jgi:CubicO group peptidase (beta-lactamase class C family)
MIGAVLLLGLALPVSAGEAIPVYGKSRIPAKAIDRLMLAHMREVGAGAAALAISKNKTFLYSKSFGWLDPGRTKKVRQTSAMRIASNSKPITAAMVLELIEKKKLRRDVRVFDYLNRKGKADITVRDPRLKALTVDHLLKHEGGWDRSASFDPVFGLPRKDPSLPPLAKMQPMDLVRYMAKQPLQFAPGERSVYSNFGFVLLARVVEAAYGKDFRSCLKVFTARHRIKGIDVGVAEPNTLLHEPDYKTPAGSYNVEVMDAAGGMIASAPGLCLFLERFWISGERRRSSGRTYLFFGSNPGTTSITRQHEKGFVYAIVINSRKDGNGEENNRLYKSLDAVIAASRLP